MANNICTLQLNRFEGIHLENGNGESNIYLCNPHINLS